MKRKIWVVEIICMLVLSSFLSISATSLKTTNENGLFANNIEGPLSVKVEIEELDYRVYEISVIAVNSLDETLVITPFWTLGEKPFLSYFEIGVDGGGMVFDSSIDSPAQRYETIGPNEEKVFHKKVWSGECNVNNDLWGEKVPGGSYWLAGFIKLYHVHDHDELYSTEFTVIDLEVPINLEPAIVRGEVVNRFNIGCSATVEIRTGSDPDNSEFFGIVAAGRYGFSMALDANEKGTTYQIRAFTGSFETKDDISEWEEITVQPGEAYELPDLVLSNTPKSSREITINMFFQGVLERLLQRSIFKTR